MAYNVTLIPGDGVGPEVTEATKRVLEATDVKFHWEIGEVGSYAMEKYGTPLPVSVIESIKKNKVALKGPVTTPVVPDSAASMSPCVRNWTFLSACVPAKHIRARPPVIRTSTLS